MSEPIARDPRAAERGIAGGDSRQAVSLPVLSPRPFREARFAPLLDCDAACPFCSTRVYAADGIRAPKDHELGTTRPIGEYTFTLRDAQATLRGLREEGVRSLVLDGGEPALYAPLPELVAYAREIGFEEVAVVSNGRRLRDLALAERIVRSGVTRIGLSLFGPSAAVHDESLGAPGAFEDLRAAVKNLAALVASMDAPARPALWGLCILHAGNLHHLPETVRAWHEAGLRAFSVRLLRPAHSAPEVPGRWFFELARLRQPLQRALDLSLDLPDLRISLREVPYCLLAPEYLAWILDDAARGDDRWPVGTIFESRFESYLTVGAAAHPALAPCASCQFAPACARVEAPHLALSSPPLRSLSVESALSALLEGVTQANHRHVRRLLEPLERRKEATASKDLGRIRAALARHYERHDPQALCDLALGGKEFVDYWQKVLRARVGLRTFRFAPRSGAPEKSLAQMRKMDEALGMALYTKRVQHPQARDLAAQLFVVVYDDQWLTEAQARRVVRFLE